MHKKLGAIFFPLRPRLTKPFALFVNCDLDGKGGTWQFVGLVRACHTYHAGECGIPPLPAAEVAAAAAGLGLAQERESNEGAKLFGRLDSEVQNTWATMLAMKDGWGGSLFEFAREAREEHDPANEGHALIRQRGLHDEATFHRTRDDDKVRLSANTNSNCACGQSLWSTLVLLVWY